jgi:multimeric flavodoxin WrbA
MEGLVMKVLGIVGSPRREGNTEILVREALLAAGDAGAETEIVLLHGKTIAPCDGCHTCFQTGFCKIKDAIIFGSPVYFQNVTAQAKAVMDRTFQYLADMRLKGKVAAPILALRRVGAGQTRNLLYGYFQAHGMISVRGAIGYGPEKGEVRTGVGGSRGLLAMEEARNVGVDIVQMLSKIHP